ncbi:MAG: hypothetical protein IJY11_01925 [Clostridia bacterium]|nr:hypothetical protein [Clostridia bacterium]
MSVLLAWEKSLSFPLSAVYALGGFAMFVAFCFSLRFKKKEGYSCCFFFFTACVCLATFVCKEGGGVVAALTGVVFCGGFGLTYPCLLGLLCLSRKRAEKRRALQERAIKEAYVLPDKDNTFIRDRLQTALCPDEDSVPVEEAFQLTYVRRMLAKLKTADLSPADRLEVERISGEITAHCFEKQLTGGQLRLLNAHFARVLKLSAKYVV